MNLRAAPPGLIEVPPFTVQVKVHPRARGLTLRYSQKNAAFTLTRPKRFNAAQLQEFLEKNRDWMDRQSRPVPDAQTLAPGKSVMIEGKTRRITHQDQSGVTVTLLEEEIIVSCRPSRFARVLQRYLQQRAADIMIPLAHDKAAAIGKTVSQITFRDTSSRWGSCSRDGKLSFSWRLVMAPLEVIDYLVAHEIAHLQHFDHSKNFWSLCRDLTPHTTFGKHWLKLNGAELHRIGFGTNT